MTLRVDHVGRRYLLRRPGVVGWGEETASWRWEGVGGGGGGIGEDWMMVWEGKVKGEVNGVVGVVREGRLVGLEWFYKKEDEDRIRGCSWRGMVGKVEVGLK